MVVDPMRGLPVLFGALVSLGGTGRVCRTSEGGWWDAGGVDVSLPGAIALSSASRVAMRAGAGGRLV